MLTMVKKWLNNGDRANNSIVNGMFASVNGDFLYPFFGSAENTTSASRIISRDLLHVVSSRNLNGFEGTLTKGSKMNNIIPFNFNNNKVRTTLIDGNPYFCLTDCCKCLNIAQTRDVVNRLKGVVKTDTLTKGGNQLLNYINEPNLYRLIFRSNKPQAQAFADWVYSEVLPSIRKTGTYSVTDNKVVTVSEHTRALPSGKKEIVLSGKAKTEIGGIVKTVLQAELTKRETMKDVMREVIREEIAPFLLSDGLQRRKELSRGAEADGLPYINWIIGIMHSATALQICMDKMQQRNKEAVELLTAKGAV